VKPEDLISANWRRIRFRYLSKTQKGRLPNTQNGSSISGKNVPYLSMEFLRGQTESPEIVKLSDEMLLAQNDDILLLWDGSNAGEFLRAKYGAVSSTIAKLTPIDIDKEFLFWACKGQQVFIQAETVGMGIPHVNGDFLADLQISVPEIKTQHKIAEYLDRETTRIDSLIAAKERQLSLLAEKRRALITQAVTRGLNADVPLRDSGIPWLGEIPTHWTILKLKYLINPISQGWSPQCDSYPAELNEWGVLKAGCVNGPTLDENENKKLPENENPKPELEIKPGDILISRANTTELLGSAVLVESVRSKLLLCDKLYRF
jgi:type I restriction enzyme S subunit